MTIMMLRVHTQRDVALGLRSLRRVALAAGPWRFRRPALALGTPQSPQDRPEAGSLSPDDSESADGRVRGDSARLSATPRQPQAPTPRHGGRDGAAACSLSKSEPPRGRPADSEIWQTAVCSGRGGGSHSDCLPLSGSPGSRGPESSV